MGAFCVLIPPMDLEKLKKECDITTFRASGPGGQHRNVTDSAVRLHHRPTGIVVIGRRNRSQHRNLEPILHQYSEALGIAYQIHDDLDDLLVGGAACKRILMRPSILMALAYDQAGEKEKALLAAAYQGKVTIEAVLPVFKALRIETQVAHLMETYKSSAIAVLSQLNNASLKGLLRRMVSKIFLDFDIMGCCNDPQTRHAQGRE